MLLTFPEALTATEHFQLGRFGELTVSADGRLFQPTDRVAPGAPAVADTRSREPTAAPDRRRSNVQNPSTVPFTSPTSSASVTRRVASPASSASASALYRLEPTAVHQLHSHEPAPAAPDSVGGDIKVASFNTLNYFTTLADDNPNARGANDAEEFTRQQGKLIPAILGLDADIVGLMEVENNGSTAISSLVDALNGATAPGTYAYITEPAINAPNEFGGTFGTDAIKVR